MKKKIAISIFALIIFINLPFFNFITGDEYSYCNADRSFVYNEEGGKGLSLKSCFITYGFFLCQHPDKDQGNKTLYRTFTIKPWRFWEWREMIFHSDRFRLPYLEPKN